MVNHNFKPFHIKASHDDLAGNNGIGRYIFLPGSNGRAYEIAQHFDHLTVKKHPRGHDLYLGTLSYQKKNIDVAAISSGMGCPSLEIILHELFQLGGKRFLRVGTAGSLQPNTVQLGHIINVHGSVRDEYTSTHYVPQEVPAIASLEFISAICEGAKKLALTEQFHTGTVHCKSSFYAREFGEGPKANENKSYMNLLSEYGVLATEMETATLFIQSQIYNQKLKQQGNGPIYRVLAGTILGVLSVPPDHPASSEKTKSITTNIIDLALETVKMMAHYE